MKFPKPLTYESADYREFVRKQPCFICGRDYTEIPVECHHESMGTGEQEQGGKCFDLMTLPLCIDHHQERTRLWASEFFMRYGFSAQVVFLAMLKYAAAYLKQRGL